MRVTNDGFPAVETMTAEEARAFLAGRRPPVANLDDVASADDLLIPGPGGDVPVRVYRPHGVGGSAPAVVFAHGGGFVLCDLDSHDSFCRAMARRTETVVVSVDYRLAPEHRAPAAARGRVRRMELGHRPGRRTRHRPVAGACRRRQCGRQPRRGHGADVPRPGRDRCLPGRCCSIRRSSRSSTPRATASTRPVTSTPATRCSTTGGSISTTPMPSPEWLVAPARAESHDGLPPAVVVTAGFDVLQSEGVSYAQRLRDANVPVVHRDYPGLFHGFVTIMPFSAGSAAPPAAVVGYAAAARGRIRRRRHELPTRSSSARGSPDCMRRTGVCRKA